ncbi:MAG: hypothetical protein EPN79_11435 [Burkholderiaceae bacterium]|nr:MAG: hypothetical protein EPN79_11435 [Burkholderiaceae bacterium]TBR76702.1 MAG: hypothetical protein EPN64_05630 [Burkholderiaceae bacterium]
MTSYPIPPQSNHQTTPDLTAVIQARKERLAIELFGIDDVLSPRARILRTSQSLLEKIELAHRDNATWVDLQFEGYFDPVENSLFRSTAYDRDLDCHNRALETLDECIASARNAGIDVQTQVITPNDDEAQKIRHGERHAG